jgi:cytochrome P450
LGAPLARVETAITINTILQRLPKLRLTADALEWHPTIVSRALKALPVAFS